MGGILCCAALSAIIDESICRRQTWLCGPVTAASSPIRVACVLSGSWAAFTESRDELHEMAANVVRGMIVVMLIVMIIW